MEGIGEGDGVDMGEYEAVGEGGREMLTEKAGRKGEET